MRSQLVQTSCESSNVQSVGRSMKTPSSMLARQIAHQSFLFPGQIQEAENSWHQSEVAASCTTLFSRETPLNTATAPQRFFLQPIFRSHTPDGTIRAAPQHPGLPHTQFSTPAMQCNKFHNRPILELITLSPQVWISQQRNSPFAKHIPLMGKIWIKLPPWESDN